MTLQWIANRLQMGSIANVEHRLRELQKVQISGTDPLGLTNYLGQLGDEPQDYVYPFATLECTLFFDRDRKANVGLMCPILEGR